MNEGEKLLDDREKEQLLSAIQRWLQQKQQQQKTNVEGDA